MRAHAKDTRADAKDTLGLMPACPPYQIAGATTFQLLRHGVSWSTKVQSDAVALLSGFET